jgi:hypothetical protein
VVDPLFKSVEESRGEINVEGHYIEEAEDVLHFLRFLSEVFLIEQFVNLNDSLLINVVDHLWVGLVLFLGMDKEADKILDTFLGLLQSNFNFQRIQFFEFLFEYPQQLRVHSHGNIVELLFVQLFTLD